ncbi:MAG: hypothetical protein CBB96_05340 [Gammaproteobacteria bacterium TMED36]|nr:MAG: hypothetical protein CBB96_05340 [Gammaproteobacteria bacterium TMED36]
MGLPGSGKTWLAERLQKELASARLNEDGLGCAWFNADAMRKMADDWVFDHDARERQSERMYNVASFEIQKGRNVICDFVCPTEMTRDIFDADIVIWMDTIREGRFEDTNKMFEEPEDANVIVTKFITDDDVREMADCIKEDCWIEGEGFYEREL